MFYKTATKALIIFFITSSNTGFAQTASLEDLEFWKIKKSEVAKVMTYDGEVEAVNQATVAAQTSGRITQLNYDVGDVVPAGAVIARITDVEQAAQLNARESQAKQAQAVLKEAQENFERAKSVFAKKLISQSDFDRAEVNFKSAQAQAKAAQAAVTAAKANLAYTEITAPYAGIVVERLVQPGETINPGSPIMTGVNLDELRVIVNVPQRHIGPIRKHQTAHVLSPSGLSLTVEKLRIPPRAQGDTHSFRILLDLPKSTEQIFPGTLVKVQFVVGNERQIMIPNDALVQRGEVSAVYIIDEQKQLSFRYVRPGQAIGQQTAVLAGLSVGETIVSNPQKAAPIYKAQREAHLERAAQ